MFQNPVPIYTMFLIKKFPMCLFVFEHIIKIYIIDHFIRLSLAIIKNNNNITNICNIVLVQ